MIGRARARTLARHRAWSVRRASLDDVSSVDPVDRFTIGHGMFGFMLGLWGVPWWVALAGTMGFELLENFALKPVIPQIFPVGTRDTLANSAFDSLAWMGGWAVARGIFPNQADYAPIWRRRTS